MESSIEMIRDKIQHVPNLPTLPQLASRLLKLINDPLVSTGEIAFVIGQDLSLSAKVLRLANSAFYGIPKSITNINSAVVILGLKVIHTMVLCLTVFDMFPESKKSEALFNRRAFWLHSLGCGIISKFLASRIRKFIMFDPEEAFCAGLLHDIGKVVMEQYLHENFHTALTVAKDKGISMFDAENETLGYNHTQIAEWLTSTWGLPPELQLPLIYHHAPSETIQCNDIVALCHLADHICYDLGLSISQHIPPALDQNVMYLLRIEQSDIDDLKERFESELDKIDAFFSVATS